MTLTLSEELVQATRLSEQQILLELAVALYSGEHLTLAQAAKLANLDRIRFQHVLAGRGLPVSYSDAGYDEDLKTLTILPAA